MSHTLNVSVELLSHQYDFMVAPERYVADIGGLGCGKSFGAAAKLYMLAYLNQGFPGMLISRSGAQLENLLIEVHKFFQLSGWEFADLKAYRRPLPDGTFAPFTYTIYNGNRIWLRFDHGVESEIFCHTAENKAYTRWAGGNRAFAVIDELDTMPEADKVWKFANDRVRIGNFLQTACSSTPEGYGFLWKFFEHEVVQNPLLGSSRRIIRGCTFDNPHIDISYVENQIMTRDPASLRAYVYGEFCNLDGTPVYYRFRNKGPMSNLTTKTIKDFPSTAVLHLGVDFNKGINATSVNIVQSEDTPWGRVQRTYAVDEIVGCQNTDILISKIRQKFPGRSILIYPDGSGFEGIQQLERAFGKNAVKYHAANPDILMTVASVNLRLCTDGGMPLTFVNPTTCPTLYAALMQQVKGADGKPDKTKGHDHIMDGWRYFHFWNWPVENPFGTIKVLNQPTDRKYTVPT